MAEPISHTRRNIWILIVLGVVIAIMLLAPRFARVRQRRISTGNPVGQAAPNFSLQDMNGKTVSLADYRGKAVVLNFWATWCPPCKIEMPWFEELQQKYGAQGLQVVGVALDDTSKEDIAKFVQEMKVNYPVVFGTEATSDAYGGVEMLPTTFYIDRNGKITDRVLGLVDKKEIEESALKIINTRVEANQVSKSNSKSTSKGTSQP